MSLKDTIQSDMKTALRAGDKERLNTVRMLLAAIQTREIETRGELADAEVLAVVEKLVKQRKDSARQFAEVGRSDREAAELREAEILAGYLPEQLGEAEIDALIDAAIAETGAGSMREMGAVMALLRERAQGRADMGALSAKVKARLGT